MTPTFFQVLQSLIPGAVFAAVLVAFVLSRKTVLARVRSARWFAVLVWLFVGALTLIAFPKVGPFVIVSTAWWVGIALHLLVWGTVFAILVCPFFALGATGLWVFARVHDARGRGRAPGGA